MRFGVLLQDLPLHQVEQGVDIGGVNGRDAAIPRRRKSRIDRGQDGIDARQKRRVV